MLPSVTLCECPESKPPISTQYELSDQVLEEVKDAIHKFNRSFLNVLVRGMALLKKL